MSNFTTMPPNHHDNQQPQDYQNSCLALNSPTWLKGPRLGNNNKDNNNNNDDDDVGMILNEIWWIQHIILDLLTVDG